jgi:hypothetical protein
VHFSHHGPVSEKPQVLVTIDVQGFSVDDFEELGIMLSAKTGKGRCLVSTNFGELNHRLAIRYA